MNPIEPTNPVLVANKELFAEFYSAYPRKVGRPSAEKAFANCKPTRELVAVMLAAIATQAKTLDWSRERLRFVPYPATWLNDERWKDDAGNRLTGISNRHPQWVLDAGFANIDEAHNARCYERFAHDFRDGKRITVAA